MNTIQKIIKKFGLYPHPEGGYFTEVYRSEELISKEHLPGRYNDNRVFSTCIYYLITKDSFFSLHKIKSDEIFHFYFGDLIEMLQLFPDGTGEVIYLGNSVFKDMCPQVIVKRDIWQGCRLKPGGKFALLGTTVAPGFDFDDFTLGNKEQLIKQYPDFKTHIMKLSK